MKTDKWAFIAYAMVWVAVAAVVGAGIYMTHEWKCLLFMIIPLFVRVRA